MNRLTKRYNENIGMYEYVDAFSGAGIFDSILKGITSKFAKDTAIKLGTKALEAGVNKVGSEVGTRAANKVLSKVFKPTPNKAIDLIVKDDKPLKLNDAFKPLGSLIMKELNDKSDDDDDDKLPSSINKALKKQYYGFGKGKGKGGKTTFPLGGTLGNKQFQNKLNRLLN